MIRFRCPICAKTLKVPDNKAGTSVLCPQCRETSMVPAESTSSYLEQPPRPPEPPGGLWRGMRGWMRTAVLVVVGVAVVELFLVIAGRFLPLSPDAVEGARSAARLVLPACFVLLLVLAWAHLTSCPACGKPWARTEGETSSLERHVSDYGNMRQVRSTRQTNYVCQYCKHTWSTTFTDEYQEGQRLRRKAKKR